MKRIAIIDDDPNILRGAAIALQRVGYDVIALSDESDLSILQANNPDLIILDVNMADAFGDDVCHFLRYQWSINAPIFLWSAIDEESLRDRADASAATGYVCKDWGFEALVTRVQATLEAPMV